MSNLEASIDKVPIEPVSLLGTSICGVESVAYLVLCLLIQVMLFGWQGQDMIYDLYLLKLI